MNGAMAPSRSGDWSAHFMVAAEKVYVSERHERFYELQSAWRCRRLSSREGVCEWPAGGYIPPVVKLEDVDDTIDWPRRFVRCSVMPEGECDWWQCRSVYDAWPSRKMQTIDKPRRCSRHTVTPGEVYDGRSNKKR
jgi:hypothetical protein